MKKPFGLLMIITLFIGCSHYIPQSESLTTADDGNKDTFLDIAIKMGKEIGQDFQNVFRFGKNIIRNMLGEPTTIDSNDNRSKIKEHLSTMAKGLTNIKNELNNKASQEENTTKEANEVIDKIIAAINKIAEATDTNIGIGETKNDNKKKASIISNKQSVQSIINGIKEIVDIAKTSGVQIEKKDDDNTSISASSNTAATAALNGGGLYNAGAGQGSGAALAKVVSEADPWIMIDKIINASIASGSIHGNDNNNAGQLITGTTSEDKGAGSKSKADLAAAVALKAMSKGGQFAAYKTDNNNEEYVKKVKEAASEAVNKVLKVLNVIILQTLEAQLGKVAIKH
ncbi:variable large family protein [Borrelia miyamotoi]|uniref:variable large family protein n=1 Tax=Borrelia miyamotoi TaxID=47466 RepID=UPI000879445D|nr:variable large family protein [Borrelia miyamotoi]AOW96232.1 hypothetical protein AXH25_04965 [Borrelia miyamotoi]WAZ96977.1 variable large family protein [Borrelia miyamotoi]WAZ98290.1 variable large family protein [Borrelia miyamotoi]